MEDGEGQEWIVVRSKKRKFIEKEVKPEKVHVKGGNARYDKESHLSLQDEFINHPNIIHNATIISTILREVKYKDIHVTCLGLGSFASFLKPQLQMQFLKICIMKPLELAELPVTINIYDPIFTSDEKLEIQNLPATCNELEEFQEEKTHIVYMPHCDRFLYQAVCKSRQAQRNCEVIVIGNSINGYKQHCQWTREEVPQVFKEVAPSEQRIKDFKQAFNDTFLYTL